jgi:hypothetical protein
LIDVRACVNAFRFSLLVGGITFGCGVLGTFLGGFILDKLGGGRGMAGVARAMQMSAACSFVAVFCAIIAVETDRLGLALAMLAIADLFLFATGMLCWPCAALLMRANLMYD